jgi:hypothetical protein
MAISQNLRVGTGTNLQVGGSYDLLLVKFVGSFPEGQISFGLYDVPMKITGLQKVAQLFLKVLMTTKGSDPFYPQRGTYFPSLVIGANLLTNDAKLLSDLNDAIRDGSSQTKQCINVFNSDNSSCLDSVQVLGIDKVPEGVIMYLSIKTLNGEEASISLPFPEFGLN